MPCWSNNVENSHSSPGAFNRRMLRTCLVPQYSQLPYWPYYQGHLANRDWMPAPKIRGQSSNPRRHPTCWTPLQWSYTVSSTLCLGTWTSAPLNAHPSIDCKCTAPQTETPICTRRTTTHPSF